MIRQREKCVEHLEDDDAASPKRSLGTAIKTTCLCLAIASRPTSCPTSATPCPNSPLTTEKCVQRSVQLSLFAGAVDALEATKRPACGARTRAAGRLGPVLRLERDIRDRCSAKKSPDGDGARDRDSSVEGAATRNKTASGPAPKCSPAASSTTSDARSAAKTQRTSAARHRDQANMGRFLGKGCSWRPDIMYWHRLSEAGASAGSTRSSTAIRGRSAAASFRASTSSASSSPPWPNSLILDLSIG